MASFLSSVPRYIYNMLYPERVREEPPSVLLITTHGEYEGHEDLEQFKSPMNIRKINAVIMGICNLLTESNLKHMVKFIIKQIKEGNISDMDKGSKLISDIFKMSDPEPDDIKNRKLSVLDDVERNYSQGSDRSYQIIPIGEGSNIYDKTYIVYPSERSKSKSPYFDTITLLTDDTPNDLVQEMLGRTYRQEEQRVKLSVILKYLKEKRGINNLIIIDLTCSVTDLSEREIRSIVRDVREVGYNQKKKSKRNPKKSKKHKKHKKPKSKGVKRRKTKRSRK